MMCCIRAHGAVVWPFPAGSGQTWFPVPHAPQKHQDQGPRVAQKLWTGGVNRHNSKHRKQRNPITLGAFSMKVTLLKQHHKYC